MKHGINLVYFFQECFQLFGIYIKMLPIFGISIIHPNTQFNICNKPYKLLHNYIENTPKNQNNFD